MTGTLEQYDAGIEMLNRATQLSQVAVRATCACVRVHGGLWPYLCNVFLFVLVV